MPLLFYRRPDYLRRDRPVLTDENYADFVERAEECKSHIPESLSFEEIVRNRTLPVSISCSKLCIPSMELSPD